MVLSDLKVGQSAVIVSLDCDKLYKKRLLEIGLTKGAKVFIIRKAPFLDPIEIKIRGFCLAIRVSIAKRIKVEKA